MEKIYVLVLITLMDRAGAETVAMNYLRHIDRDRIQMDFVINRDGKADYEDEITALGSKIYHMPPLYPGSFSKYKRKFREFLIEHPKYRIIHSHLEERSFYALNIAKKLGVPVRIAHAHAAPKGVDLKLPVRLYFRKRLKKTYTHRFSCGKAPAEWLYGTTKDVIMMKNAIDTELFAFNGQMRKEVRDALGVADDTLVLGHVGRFTKEKNHDFLIDIFAKIHEKNTDSILLLIGGGRPKEEVRALAEAKEKVERMHLVESVKFLGVRDDVCRWMQAMDVLALPSTSEGFPVTLLEAQTAGLECVVSDAVSRECALTDNVCYMPLSKGADAWAEQIIEAAHKGGDKENVRKDTADIVRSAGYDIKDNAKWLEKFYEEVI